MTNSTLALLNVRGFPSAAAALLLTVLAQSTAAFYMALVMVERAGMTPLELSAFLTLSAASSIGVTTVFSNWFDRAPSRLPILIAIGAGLVGYPLVVILTDKLALMAVALCLLGTFGAGLALLFALAKAHLDHTDAHTSSAGMAAMRMINSLAWGIGPSLGAILVTLWSYEGAFFGGAYFAAAALLFAIVVPMAQPVHTAHERVSLAPGLWRSLGPALVAMMLFHGAMFIGSTALSLAVVGPLGGSEADIGWIQTVCAVVEVVVMGWFVVRPARTAGSRAIVVGFLLLAAYFLALLLIPALATAWWAQVLRGTAIALVNVLGMLYVQERMPGRAGAASGLFSNAFNAGWLLSGIGTGLWANQFGYWSLFWLCTAMSLLGALLFAAGARRGLPVTPAAAGS